MTNLKHYDTVEDLAEIVDRMIDEGCWVPSVTSRLCTSGEAVRKAFRRGLSEGKKSIPVYFIVPVPLDESKPTEIQIEVAYFDEYGYRIQKGF